MTKPVIEKISRRAFNSLLEYSASLPTGTQVGKVWKRNLNVGRESGSEPDWWIGEYVSHPDPDKVGIEWRKIEIVD